MKSRGCRLGFSFIYRVREELRNPPKTKEITKNENLDIKDIYEKSFKNL